MSTLPNDELTIHFPDAAVRALQQDQEYFDLEQDGHRRRIRFHDYAQIYAIPGLYEYLFAETLMCRSPEVVVDLLQETLLEHQERPGALRALDLGAGNGMVGEQLERIGVRSIIGVDELEEAKQAAQRDRPGTYDAYYAIDITAPDPIVQRELESTGLNCLTCVAALGFGDIPVAVFQAALDLIADDGWVAFNIRDRFITDTDRSGFADLLDAMIAGGELVEHARLRYPHRLGVSGEPLHYVAIVAQKVGSGPVSRRS